MKISDLNTAAKVRIIDEKAYPRIIYNVDDINELYKTSGKAFIQHASEIVAH